MKLTRFPDWPERLAKYFEENVPRFMIWGQHDCVLFALGAAKELTGVDTVDKLRGQYHSALGALKEMRHRYNASNLSEAADAVQKEWGVEQVPVLMAQRGDIVEAEVVLPDGTTGPSLGVVDLNGTHALFAGVQGAIKIPVKLCKRAWRIGD